MEHIRSPKVDNVKLVDRLWDKKSVVGTLYVTATHLIFMDPACTKEKWILHAHISEIEKLPLTHSGCPIKIICKTFHVATFVIPREKQCFDIMYAVNKLSHPDGIEDLYAFSFKSSDLPNRRAGWKFYDMQTEYERMGIPNKHWQQCFLNENYELCDTYPRCLFVPASAKNRMILGSSKFRSRGRLPVLSYFHQNNQAAICRCSQPLAGFSARCLEDEELLQAIYDSNPNSAELFVVDTRPMINAVANAAAGKGFEKESNYSNIKFQFVGIENIHSMRTSLQKLIEVSDIRCPTVNTYMTALEASGWLKHIRTILETSVFIAMKISQGTSVLVHCSDGWDRTAQTCSLASMMLDPYYRTFHGFQALIEKEWLSFGHKFTDRCGLISVIDAKEESPVFTQFLDCTWQMMNQFPTAFQFNERFLLHLHDHVYSSQFGTFLGNCEKDRIDLRLSERTYSLWGFIAKNISDYINPFYRKDCENQKSLLMPQVCPQFFRYWKGMYNRFDTSIHERENLSDVVSALVDHNSSLEDHNDLLEKRVQELAKLLGRPIAVISQKLQGLLSAESLYCLNDLLRRDATTGSELQDIQRTTQSLASTEYEAKLSDGTDDVESGFEDSSSLSKSNMTESIIRWSEGLDSLTLDQIYEEIGSVAINLKSLRNKQQCACSIPFEHCSKRYHCWKCGNVFCSKCIERYSPLAGHYSQKPAPVCKACYKTINKTRSSANLAQYMEQHVLSEDISPLTPDETNE